MYTLFSGVSVVLALKPLVQAGFTCHTAFISVDISVVITTLIWQKKKNSLAGRLKGQFNTRIIFRRKRWEESMKCKTILNNVKANTL
ncbi:hypothetical protein SBF1_2970008 [Candidatus Desulfosporosinus infrequens]|uniref:Secreted protein n=1 Tax=Candidatus Desulfosporosinus infrequens TaxID=2043169 RepID=A0A2U3KWH6_9FIRM|nr:hypothetical protein SBF1_2970008 [Candidatus Desulfosporosinus infrequens]